MRLVHKDGIMVMDVDESADDDLIAMLKTQGWSEPSYYCKNCGEVPMSKGLCSCFGKQGGEMKYSIGDRVIVKETGGKGIVVERDGGYGVWCLADKDYYDWFGEHELLTDLTAIEKPFGLLSREVQEELKAVNNGRNICFYNDANRWFQTKTPAWAGSSTYRLDPNWKQEEVKEMTVGEIEAKLGHKVKIIKGE